jgi:predicted alpha/beta-fold hydrolase|tara:strand:+ start:314 stop:586 length:273 start_codon:yes stop_codon:yes gene_type:complete
MLFLSARNDPVAPADVIDSRPFEARGAGSEAAPLLLAVTREGGHSMTWPEGWRGGGRDWSTAVLCEFVAAVVESNSESTTVLTELRVYNK